MGGVRAPVGPTQPIDHLPRVQAAPSRRRWIPLLILMFLIAPIVGLAAVALALPFETKQLLARYGLRTGTHKSRVGAFPLNAEGELPRFRRRRIAAPETNGSLDLASPVFDIGARSSSHGPYEISLPLLDREATEEDSRIVVLGRYADGDWVPMPTEIIEDRAWGVSAELGTFAAWFAAAARDGTDTSAIRIDPPEVSFGRVRGDAVSVLLDLRMCSSARAPDAPWGPRVPVTELRVEVARGSDEPTPYELDGEALTWDPSEQVGLLPIALEAVTGLEPNSTIAGGVWRLRVVPVFDDDEVGEASETIDVPVPLVLALAQMRRELPLPERRRRAFLEASAEPLGVVFNPYLGNAYNPSIGWSARRLWGRVRAGVRIPHIGIARDARFVDATHEWGHYAVHVIFGDEAHLARPSEPPERWVETTRERAYREDLATFLGQVSTGHGAPAAIGAMRGHPYSMSRHPEGANLASKWPRERDMDALAVQAVIATVLSRIARDIGAAVVLEAIIDLEADTLVELIARLLETHRAAIQPTLLDEGVSWRVAGRVVDDEGEAVGGVTVRVQTLEGAPLNAPREDASTVSVETDAEGEFVVRVPPGEVKLAIESDAYAREEPVRFTPSMDSGTNATPQTLEEPIEVEASRGGRGRQRGLGDLVRGIWPLR